MRKITRLYQEAFLQRHASKEHTLDIGAGGNTSHLAFFPDRITLDINPENKPDVIGDAHDLPFADNEFPTVLCSEVLEHLLDPRKAVAEMRRVLKPGGTLVLTTRFVFPLHSSYDYWRFTHYGLEQLFADWEIIELVPETIDFETIAVLLQRIGFQSTMRFNKLSKGFLYLLSSLAPLGNKLIVKRFGHITKTLPETHIMASGYYIAAKKPS